MAETAVAIQNTQPVNSPFAMVLAGKAQGLTVEELDKFMDLQIKWEANQARKAYSQAMSDFKADPPEIDKDKKVSYKTTSGVTAYNHASLGNVTEKINSALSKYGLSAGWTTKQDGTNVTVTCRISHSLGHSEETSLTAALDTSGGKNTIQALGSTITYLERYTILALTGLATSETDDDGMASEEIKYISDKERSTIIDMMASKDVKEDRFCKFMNVESIEKIMASDFTKAMAALRSKPTPEQKTKEVVK
ncbi:MAG: ERF family protein [Smithella sp.]|jgi:hypothetical protein